jgi:hypothetical protein
MRMKIGQRTIEARIDRQQAARQIYEAARQAGQAHLAARAGSGPTSSP